MSAPVGKWTGRLVEAVLSDSGDPIVRERLDALIRWLAGVKSPDCEAITLEFEKHDTSERQAQQLALVSIDPILFAGGASAWQFLGLAPGTAPEAVKQRYYRLTKIYHPDRQLSAEEWLNERTEKINRAYDEVKRGRAPATAMPMGSGPARSVHARPAPGNTISVRASDGENGFGEWLRQVLGGSERLQRNAIIAAVSTAGLVLVLFALQGNEPYVSSLANQSNEARTDSGEQSAAVPAQAEAETDSLTEIVEDNADVSVEKAAYDADESQQEVPQPVVVDIEPPPARDAGPDETLDPLPAMETLPDDIAIKDDEPQRPQSDEAGNEPGVARVSTSSEIWMATAPVKKPGDETATELRLNDLSNAIVLAVYQPTVEPGSEPVASIIVKRYTDSTSEPTGDLEPAAVTTVSPYAAPGRDAEETPTRQAQSGQAIPVDDAQAAVETEEPQPTGTSTLAATSEPIRIAAIEPPLDTQADELERLREKMRFFLARYANYYAKGDAASLAGLYEQNAIQDKFTSRVEIEGYYARYFRLTESRELDFQLRDVELRQDDYRVTADYRARLGYKGGRAERLSGSATFNVGHHGINLIIREAAYQ